MPFVDRMVKASVATVDGEMNAIHQGHTLRPALQIWRRSAIGWLHDLEVVLGSPEQQARCKMTLRIGFTGSCKRIQIRIQFGNMAQTVRIDENTHELLRDLARADGVSLNEELTRAVQARKRERFFADMAAGYAALTDKERQEEATERALWDRTARDGLDSE